MPVSPRKPKLKSLLAAATLLLATASCHFNEKFSSPLWFYYYSSPVPSKWDTLLNRASFLNLQPDGTYTQDFGHFEYGQWTLKHLDLYLTNQEHKTYIFHLPIIGSKELDVYLGKNKVGYFQKQPRPSGNASDNPFSLTNNQWRIPATHKETVAEIRQRLLNHYHFWEAYFKWGFDNKVSPLNVTDIPTPMKIYANGFGLKRYDSLSIRWRSCFFDTADCHIADTLIKGTFRRNTITWPDTEDEGKTFVSGIQQVESFLKNQ